MPPVIGSNCTVCIPDVLLPSVHSLHSQDGITDGLLPIVHFQDTQAGIMMFDFHMVIAFSQNTEV